MKLIKPNKQLSHEKRRQAIEEWNYLYNTLNNKQNPNSIINAYNKKWSGVAIIVIHAGKIRTLLYK